MALIVVSCSPLEEISPSETWKSSQLRLISNHGSVPADIDMIAAYTREAGSDIQIRLDFLDLTFESDIDIFIALDTGPGGTTQLPNGHHADVFWDTLLVIPQAGMPQVISYIPPGHGDNTSSSSENLVIRTDIIPRIIRVPWQDTVIISINKMALPQYHIRSNLQVFSAQSGMGLQIDKTVPFKFSSPSPSPAPLVLAFWNTYPAYSPAQALRRWDGAHTGPFGERHGLAILLDNVSKTSVPVVLLDLRNPLSLNAIDAIGGLPQILDLQSKNLLILPDMLPGSPGFPLFPRGLPSWGSNYFVRDSNNKSMSFGLHTSQILYTPDQKKTEALDYRVIFKNDFGSTRESLASNQFLPIPGQAIDQQAATPEGLTLSLRKSLLENALKMNHAADVYPLIIIGGDFSESSFGDPQSARATLNYIANHPWIAPLGHEDLLNLPKVFEAETFPEEMGTIPTASFSPSNVLSTLPVPEHDSQNPLFQSAWESAITIYSALPPEPDSLLELRSVYSGQPGIVLEAARWASDPKSRSDCAADPDQDGLFECILASEDKFGIFDLEGGRLIAYYQIINQTVHQIIAPTSQFIVGTGDPSTWLLDAGEGADTEGIHGAFADSQPPWAIYEYEIGENHLIISSPGNDIVKRFSLTENGLRIDYQSPGSIEVRIPIAVDPWERFTPGWKDLYQGNMIPGGYELKFSELIQVEVLTDAQIEAAIFNQSPATFDIPENPNFDYPDGHYLPHPVAVTRLNSSGSFSVDLNVRRLIQ